MNYRITYTGAEGVCLQRTGDTIILPILGTLMGCLLGGIGAVMFFTSTEQAHTIGLAFMSSAPLFLILPFIIIRKERNFSPKKIVFDNRHNLVALVQTRNVTEPAFIPYTELIEFDVIKDSRTSTSTRSSTVTYSHIVRCLLKNGMYWQIATFSGNSNAAEEMVKTLRHYVHISDTISPIPLGELPESFSITTTHTQTEFTWRNNPPWGIALLLLLFFGTFFSLLYFIGKASANESIILYLMCGVGVIVFGGVMYDLFKSSSGKSSLIITNDNLIWDNSIKVIPLHDIACVSTDISQALQCTLLVLTKEHISHQMDLYKQDVSIKDIWMEIKKSFTIPSIEIGVLPLTQRITIQHYINREITRRKNEDVTYRTMADTAYWWQFDTPYSTRNGRTNVHLGVIVIALACIPVVSLAVFLTMYKSSVFPYIVQAFYGIDAIRMCVAVYAGYILAKQYNKKHRGYSIIVLPFAIVALHYFNYSTNAQLLSFALMIPMFVCGYTFLTMPEDE